MTSQSQSSIGAGVNARPRNTPIGESAPGIPDDAIGQGEPPIEETLRAGEDPQSQALARRLSAEAASWRARGDRDDPDEPSGDDPQGHA